MAKINLNTVAGLDAMLDSLDRRRKTWKTDMQSVLSNMVKSYKSSGDHETYHRLATRAVAVASYDNEAVVNWLVNFGGLSWDEDGFANPDKTAWKEIRDGLNMEEVFNTENAYFKFMPEKTGAEISVFDIRAEMVKLIEKAEKRLEAKTKGSKKARPDDVVDADAIKKLREVSASL